MKALALRALLCIPFVCMSAFAQNIMFMRDSPIAHLNSDDRTILRETIDKALQSPDGTVIEWSNPESGSKGRVKVLDTHQDPTLNTMCRNVRARNEARGRRADGIYRLCRSEDGKWRFAAPQDLAHSAGQNSLDSAVD